MINTSQSMTQLVAIQAKLANLEKSLKAPTSVDLKLPNHEAWKLRWFDAKRPVLSLTPEDSKKAARAFVQALTTNADGSENITQATTAAGRSIANSIADRLEAGAFSPLSPAYVSWKAKHGMPTTPGVATGELVKQLRACVPVGNTK